jgi:hypothetical protein
MHFTHIKRNTYAACRSYSLMYDVQILLCTYVGITNDGGRNASNE